MDSNENELDLIELVKILWSNKRKLIIYGAIGFCVGIVIALSIPKVYNTTIKIAPEGSSVSESQGLGALAGFAGINLNSGSDGLTSMIYPDIVRSTPFLLEFVNVKVENNGREMTFFEYVTENQRQPWWGYIISAPGKLIGFAIGIFSDKKEEEVGISIFKPSLDQKKYINFLHDNIGVSSDKKTNILTISVNTQNACISALIADTLTNKLQMYMTEYKTGKIRKDLLAKEEMLDDAKNNYYNAEERLAEGLDYNRNITTQTGQVKINRLINEKDLAFIVYQQLATQVASTKIELQHETPIATTIEPASIAVKASGPNKPLIVIMFSFIFGAAMAAYILYENKFFSSKE